MALTRKPDWTASLHEFLLAIEHDPFAYGTSDCCLVAANAVKAITGVDIAGEFRGRYSTALGSARAIRRITGGLTAEDAIAYVAAEYDLPEWPSPLLAQRGDLVVIRNGSEHIGGVVHLNGRHAVSIGERGLVRLPTTAVTRAWKV